MQRNWVTDLSAPAVCFDSDAAAGILVIVKKAKIIAEALKNVRGRETADVDESGDDPAYEEHARNELERRLCHIEPDVDLPTCADFTHLEGECCPVCHLDYPEYELAVIELEAGGRAWICCSLDRALNPAKCQATHFRTATS